jgi:putative peptide zinc metalloprotease protein
VSHAASLFSDHWYRVAADRPRLADHVRVDRQRVRGETWYVLSGEDDGGSLRLDGTAYAVAARCDGQASVQEIWNGLQDQLGDAAPGQDDVLNLLTRLNERQWLNLRQPADVAAVAQRRQRQQAAQRLQRLNPLAIRMPLLDLRPLLARFDGVADRIYSRHGAMTWSAVVASGVLAALLNSSELLDHANRWMQTPRYLLLGLLVYPFVKLVHELAHALAIRRWRGELGSAGLALLAFLPVPWVDASAANRFPRAGQRATVSIAGVAAELAIASLCLWLWLWLDDGLARDLAFVACVICGVASVAVNANPLLRFDGYFALCDLLGLPNLATRSRALWAGLLRQRLLDWPGDAPLHTAPGERPWLLAYAPLSVAYQLLLAVTITGWLGGISAMLGLLSATLFAALLIGRPLRNAWRSLRNTPLPQHLRSTVLARASMATVAVAACLTALPVPDRTIAQGVVWMPEHAMIRAQTDGFIDRFLVADGATLRAGQVVATLSNPQLVAEQQRIAAHIAGLQTELFGAMQSDPALAEQVRQDLAHAGEKQATLAERVAGLELRAAATGLLAMPRQRDRAGTFVQRGELLGYAITGAPAIVRVAVPQEQAARIRDGTAGPEVRLAGKPASAWRGRVIRDGGAALPRLPSPALSTWHGGSIVTEPDDDTHQTPLHPVVTVDVMLPASLPVRVGERAWVRFDHGWRPLGQQWLREADQWLRRHFNPAT